MIERGNERRKAFFSMPHALIFGFILVLGIALRLWGIAFDYPYLTHADEPAIVEEAIKMAEDRTLLSYQYDRPDNGVKKPLSVIYRIYSIVMGDDQSPGAPLVRRVGEGTEYYIIGRVYVAFLGAALMVCAWYIGCRFSPVTGLLAALAVAVLEPFVEHSQFVTSDIAVTLSMALCMIAALHYQAKPTRARLLPMALTAALGTLDKYPGILTCGMIAVAVIWEHRRNIREIFIQGIIAFALYVLLIFLISPNLFICWKDVLARLAIENRSSHLGADGYGLWGNMLFYINRLAYALCIEPELLLVLLALSAAAMVIRRDKRALILVSGLFWWVLLSTRALHWERWGLPMFFAGVLLLCCGIGVCCEVVQKAGIPRRLVQGAVMLAAAAYMFVQPMEVTLNQKAEQLAGKTYLNAMAYAEQIGATRENSAYDGRTPVYMSSSPTWTTKMELKDDVLFRKDSRIRYIVQGEEQKKRYFASGINPQAYHSEISEYLWAEANLEPMSVFEERTQYPRSTIGVADKMAKLIYGVTGNRITGGDIVFYDVQALPLSQTITRREFAYEKLGDESVYRFVLDHLTAGEYVLSVNGAQEVHVRAAAGDDEAQYDARAQGYVFALSEEKQGLELSVCMDAEQDGFESVQILQTSGGFGQE